jgi:hypothetical protein
LTNAHIIKPYNAARKTVKWYKKLTFHLIQVAVLNAHIIYLKEGGTKAFLGYSHDVSSSSRKMNNLYDVCNMYYICLLIFQVIASLVFPGDNDQPAAAAADNRVETIVCLTERHFPSRKPDSDSWKKPVARYGVCAKNGICAICPSQPGLCVEPCFELWHTKRKYWD